MNNVKQIVMKKALPLFRFLLISLIFMMIETSSPVSILGKQDVRQIPIHTESIQGATLFLLAALFAGSLVYRRQNHHAPHGKV